MIPLPPEKAGADNDLNEKIERYIKRAIEEKAIIYAFGERWGQRKYTIPIFISNQETVYMIFT